MIAARPGQGLAVAIGSIALLAIYCQAHSWAAGDGTPIGVSLRWAVAMALPAAVLAAGIVRTRRWLSRLPLPLQTVASVSGILFATLAATLLATGALPGAPADWLVDRLPLIAAGSAAIVFWARRRAVGGTDGSPLLILPGAPPLLKREISLVRAAGNYVELHTPNRIFLARAGIAGVARLLAPDGFVRVHRCAIVNPSWIDRIERGASTVALRGGERVRIGRAYARALRSSH